MFLTSDEIEQLTGYIKPGKQVQWLEENGFIHKVAASGRPVVSSKEFDRVMCGEKQEKTGQYEPNWTAMPKAA